MKLSRMVYMQSGVFGTLSDNDTFFVKTLEHAYSDPNSSNYSPKIPPGVYTCVRGQHQLAGMLLPFETFEVTNVPGHTGILFHSGNTNADSSGCILLGLHQNGNFSLLESRAAFQEFMKYLDGVESFELTVE